MEHITKSREAMTLMVAAAVVFVLGLAFEVAAYATLTPTSFGTSTDFVHASDWLRFAGGVGALVAVCAAGWELVLHRSWDSVWEVGVAALGTLLIAIGLLMNATSGQSSSASNVVSAVGIGVWALLVLSRAARRSLAEEQSKGAGAAVQHQAILWLVAACGLAVFAVGFGFTLNVASKSTGITAGALEAAGAGILFGAVAAARTRGYVPSRAVPAVLAGLAILAAAFIAAAVVSGLVFGPDATLTGLRVGISVVTAIQLAAITALGIGAWVRIQELVLSASRPDAQPR